MKTTWLRGSCIIEMAKSFGRINRTRPYLALPLIATALAAATCTDLSISPMADFLPDLLVAAHDQE